MYEVSAYVDGKQVGDTVFFVTLDFGDTKFLEGVLRGLLMVSETAELRMTFNPG